MLGLRSAVREDSACCPADLVFGAPVRLPADLVDPAAPSSLDLAPDDFVDALRGVLRASAPMPFRWHGNTSSQVPRTLTACTHVFIRIDAVCRPLNPPYEGPHKVLQKGPKTFTVERSGKPYTVSINRLKPAFTSDFGVAPPAVFVPPETPAPSSTPVSSTSPSTPEPERVLDPVDWPLPTRFGRRPRPVARLGID